MRNFIYYVLGCQFFLVEELSKRTGKNKLLQLSEVEQNICVGEDHGSVVQSIRDRIDDKEISGSSILRLISLYAIKYGSQNEQTLRSLSAAACQAKSINRSGCTSRIFKLECLTLELIKNSIRKFVL